ncbi:MAG: hypothetical protein ACO1PW_12425 [Actinomycetota bacterium]
MTARLVLVVAQRLLAWVVLLVSGLYLIVYLYRWEWNRAIISGLFFVAAEVALVSGMLHRRLRAIEAAVQDGGPARSHALTSLRATPAARPNPFRWLDPRDRPLSVFVPVLLGAGVILSALAYLVQRVAEVTALPVADRHLARRLDAIALPAPGGTTGPSASGRPPEPERREHPAVTGLGWALAVGAVVVLGWLGIQTLMEAAQTRADPAARPVRTTIEMDVVQRHRDTGAVAAAEALWVGCQSTLGSQATEAHVEGRGGTRVALVLEPGVGRLTERRLTGCLADLRVNLVIAHVREVETVRSSG